MKKIFALLVGLVFALGACDDNFNQISEDLNKTGEGLASQNGILGTWEVERYVDDGDNETSYFRNITFVIQDGGQFIIQRNSNNIATGTWQLRDNDRELDINVPILAGENEILGEEIYEIHDDWDIIKSENNELDLRDDDERFDLKRVSNNS